MGKKTFRKLIGVLLVVVMLISAMPLGTVSYAETSGDYEYSLLDDGTVMITKYVGAGGDVIIPQTIDGKAVTRVGSAFSNCTKLTSVTVPDSVKYIGIYGFYKCSGLTSVFIGNGVTSIDDYAFAGCSELTSITVSDNNPMYSDLNGVLFDKGKTILIQYPAGKSGSYTIPDGVTAIGISAFEYCSGLTSVIIPNSVTTIGEYAFHDCGGLTSVTIPDSVTTISGYAFWLCRNLTSVTIPNSVTSIGDFTFADCNGLTSVIIPDSVTTIGDSAFYDCSGLTSVIIPNSVTSISASAFYDCSGLTSVIIPNSVTTIDGYTFAYCSGLTSVTIPGSVTTIGENAFAYCSGLTSVNIPNSVTTIGDSAFSDCASLKAITVDSDNENYSSINGVLFNKQQTILIQYPGGASRSYTIPDSVTTINSRAFSWCSSLTSITIPDSVTNIGSSAFAGCTGLTSITIPDSVTTIDNYAFLGCNKLTSIIIPDSVTTIDDDAFYDCGGLTIKGYKGSEAERYANDNGFIFEEIDPGDNPKPTEPITTSPFVDLVASEVNAVGENLQTGDVTKVYVVIRNNGNTDYSGELLINFAVGGSTLEAVAVNVNIAAGKSVVVSSSKEWTADFGSWAIRADINYKHTIQESNYNNNGIKARIAAAD